MRLAGRWRLVEMELWDPDAIDLVSPGFIEFDGHRSGRFGFIAVEGQLDCREVIRDGRPCVEFTWEGMDDSDPASGRGWAVLADDGTLDGRIFFHLGDDSSFHAVRAEPTIDVPGLAGADADERRNLSREAVGPWWDRRIETALDPGRNVSSSSRSSSSASARPRGSARTRGWR